MSSSASQDQVCRMSPSTPTYALPSIWKKQAARHGLYEKKTPDLLGAYTTAGAACACWAAAKRALGRDDMIIVGTDYTDETLDLVESGEVQASWPSRCTRKRRRA